MLVVAEVGVEVKVKAEAIVGISSTSKTCYCSRILT